MENLTRPVQRLSQLEFEHIKILKQRKYENLKHGMKLQKNANSDIMGFSRNLCIFFGVHMVQYFESSDCNTLFYFTGLGLLGVLTFCLPTYSMIESMSKQVDWLVDNDRILRMRVDLLANNIRDNIEIVQVATDLGGGPPTLVANVRLFSQVFYRGKSISLLESLKEFVSEPSVPTNFKFHYMMVVAILYLFGISYFFGVAATLYGTMCGHENLGKNNIGNLDFMLLQPT